MADDNTPDTPDTSVSDTSTPRRRAAPRQSGGKTSTRRTKSAAARAEGAVERAATSARDAVVAAEERVVRAVRPRAAGRAAARPAASRKAGTSGSAAVSTGGRGKAAGGRGAAKKTREDTGGTRTGTGRSRPSRGDQSTLDRATSAVGGKWAAAAIGAVAAAGATAAAMLTLRGSSAKSGKNVGTSKKPIDISGTGDKGQGHATDVHGAGAGDGAHQPDGRDSSASFNAGIADENSIPDKA